MRVIRLARSRKGQTVLDPLIDNCEQEDRVEYSEFFNAFLNDSDDEIEELPVS